MISLALLSIMLSARFGGGEPQAMPKTSEAACRMILAQQTADGAITMAKLMDSDSSVVTYFSCFAAKGLLAVYSIDGDKRKLTAAKKWARWYAAHQNADGTIFDYSGRSGAWKSSGHFDSTDSYAAVYLDLLLDIVHADGDTKFVRSLRPSIVRALAGIRLTMQPAGLTTAQPTYPVMYTMDNVETLAGLRAAHRLALVLDDKPMADRTKAEADKMEAAIGTLLWDSIRSSYRIGIQVDGGKMEGLREWYPDIMANLMAIGWLPPSTRNRELYARLRAQFPNDLPEKVGTLIDVEHLVWWGFAAQGAGDATTLAKIRQRLAPFESVCPKGCDAGLLGHIARLTAVRS